MKYLTNLRLICMMATLLFTPAIFAADSQPEDEIPEECLNPEAGQNLAELSRLCLPYALKACEISAAALPLLMLAGVPGAEALSLNNTCEAILSAETAPVHSPDMPNFNYGSLPFAPAAAWKFGSALPYGYGPPAGY